jgi:drug/metabolite transporter (DMT)-like permease
MTRPPEAAERRSRILVALAWMSVALVSFSLISVAGREAGRAIDTLQMVLWRCLMSSLVLLAWAVATGQLGSLRTTRPGLHGLRGILHFVAQFSWLHALTLIPLAQLFALEFTAPLWVAVLAPLVLAERLTPVRIAAALLGFLGVLTIVRPGVGALDLGSVLAMVAAFGFASSMICTKILTRSDSPFTILIYMMTLQTLIAFALGWRGLAWPDGVTLGWLAVMALAGLAAHFALTKAFSLADAIIVAPMDFLRLPLIAVVGAVLYGEGLAPTLAIGALIIVAANTLNLWGERRAAAVAAAARPVSRGVE